uniref:Ubiquitin-like domain-containing protein n=1 Tax=Arcella intermedia TaxID=1963864 RepID=A0A6B2LI95_9EUKA
MDIEVDSLATLHQFRVILEEKTGIPPQQQKLMFKGTMNQEDKTLKDLQIVNKSKIMLIGTKVEETKKIAPETAALQTNFEDKKEEENVLEQPASKKVIEKGPPANGITPYGGKHEPLPSTGIPGLVNKQGSKIRLTFKPDQLWIGSPESTQKLPFGSVSDIQTLPIPNHPHYHVVVLKLGGNSQYPIFWVPEQYLRAISVAILGWQG